MPKMKQNFLKSLNLLLFLAVLLSGSPSVVSAYSNANFFAKKNIAISGVAKKYIVVLRDDVSDVGSALESMKGTYGFLPSYTYKSALNGFAAELTPQLLVQLGKDSRVQFISEDKEVHLLGFKTESSGTPLSVAGEIVPTGVQRIGGPDKTYKGKGVGVAIIDTGIDLTHPDLKGSIIAHTNCVGFSASGDDDHGHGSHVAGIIAAEENGTGVVGVAPKASLIAVKVLNAWGSGSWSSVICGIDWVTKNAAKYNIKVANMSLGGVGKSDNNCGNTDGDAMHKAICKSAKKGVTYVVAAGNSYGWASSSVPAAYDDTLITVSALADSDGKPFGMGTSTSYGPDDTFAPFSNYGPEVDIGAPGVDIFSSYLDGQYTTMSGTSMASPHVAGAAALYVEAHPGSTWKNVRDGLRSMAYTFYSGHSDPSGNHPEPVLRLDFKNFLKQSNERTQIFAPINVSKFSISPKEEKIITTMGKSLRNIRRIYR